MNWESIGDAAHHQLLVKNTMITFPFYKLLEAGVTVVALFKSKNLGHQPIHEKWAFCNYQQLLVYVNCIVAPGLPACLPH